MAGDRRDGNSPDHVLAQVDQETGILLQLVHSGPAGVTLDLAVERFEATAVDRAEFDLQPPTDPAPVVTDLGFERVPLGEAGDRLGTPVLVPAPPPGFGNPVVAVNPDDAAAVGADGDIPSHQVAVMTWRLGFLALTVTQRDDLGIGDDPFGTEGVVLAAAPVEARVGDGTPLDGQLTVDPPAAPHLWAVAGDRLITVDGGLAGSELLGVARSLYPD